MNGIAANEKAVAVWQHGGWEKAKKVTRVHGLTTATSTLEMNGTPLRQSPDTTGGVVSALGGVEERRWRTRGRDTPARRDQMKLSIEPLLVAG